MLKKLIALYKTPPDADAFLKHYRETHLPLTARLPGLVKSEVTQIKRTLAGDTGWFLVAELYFDSDESFKSAMKSPENAALGADLKSFAEGLVTIVSGETL